MSTTFIDALRDRLKTGGWATKENDREEGGTLLVGVQGQLFAVYDDYQVAKAADGFARVGCGDQVALGALFATAPRQPRAEVNMIRSGLTSRTPVPSPRSGSV
jgi:hypothetical protein